MQQKRYQTSNSFTKKPSLQQVIAYIIVLGQFCLFYIAIQQNFQSETTRIIFHVFFGLSMGCQIIGGLICSIIDPVDSYVLQFKSGDIQRIENMNKKINDQQLSPYVCQYCNSFVKQTSKHCRMCDRCCQDFDHHCVWINNCIGNKNYKYFIFMLVSCLVTKLILISSIIALTSQKKWSNYLPSITLSWIGLAIYLLISAGLFGLSIFHFYLIKTQQTTFDFIMGTKNNQPKNIKQNHNNTLEQFDGSINPKISQNIQVQIERKQNPSQKQIHQNNNLFIDNYSKKTQPKQEQEINSKKNLRHTTKSQNFIQKYFSQGRTLNFLISDAVYEQPRQSSSIPIATTLTNKKLYNSDKKIH